MSENVAAKRLFDSIPAIMQRWDDRVRGEVSPAAGAPRIVLRDSLAQMLEVMAKVLGDQTEPRTAARDLAYLTVHGKERANQTTYSLEELILEFHILQEVVLEALEPDHLLDTRDRGVIIQYVNEMVRVAAGAFVGVQQTLQAYADRLTQTDRSKDEFLAMLGHELRNPLGAISTALFLLQEGPADPATQKGALEVATRQARHMKQMLDGLLDVARINEGKIALQRTRVDLGTELQQALEVAQRLFVLRKHVVSLSQPMERIYVMADPVRLGQCSRTSSPMPPNTPTPAVASKCPSRATARARWCACVTMALASRPIFCRTSSTCSGRPLEVPTVRGRSGPRTDNRAAFDRVARRARGGEERRRRDGAASL